MLGYFGCGSDGGTGGGGSASTSGHGGTTTGTGGASTGGAAQSFVQPTVCAPATGCTEDQLTHGKRVTADLKAGAAKRTLPAAFADPDAGADAGEAEFDVSLYNGLLPGPTIELTVGEGAPATDGDLLQIKLTNTGQLDVCCCGQDQCPLPAACADGGTGGAGVCQRWDGETNMHTHGFHIASTSATYGNGDPCEFQDPAAPDLPWDDVFVTVPTTSAQLTPCSWSPAPACTISNVQQFVYPLPPHQTPSVFQPAPTTHPHWFGLEWYHPHMHMTTADQVGRGMAGALLVHNPVEATLPALAGVGKGGDLIFFLQRLATNDNTKVARLVNGRRDQVLTIAPGETQRWRLLDAAADNTVRISVKDAAGHEIPYYPIGYDGVPLPAVGAAMRSYLLLPGNRLEVLFRPPPGAKEGDEYHVTWCEPALAPDFSPLDPLGPDQPCTGPTESVVTVEVQGSAVAPQPATLPGSALAKLEQFGLDTDLWAPGTKPDATHTIKFDKMEGSDGQPMFTIDDVPFDMNQACNQPFHVKLGTMEEWTLVNVTSEIHTFHIHVNPFQAEPAAGAAPYYQDNILLPPGPPGDGGKATTPTQTKVRMRFVDYPGTAVFHCHVLFHEDHGMMAAFVVDP
jgi:FtsP/CotA-like multicopper oxidase with cupredoxin domain